MWGRLGIPPPYPFCEAWPSLPPDSTPWLVPGVMAVPSHYCTPATQTPDARQDSDHQPVTGAIRPPPGVYDRPTDEPATNSDSEYEYGFILNEEWAEHFSRKQRQTKTKARRPRRKKKAANPAANEPNPLLYELSVGALEHKTWRPETTSARVDALERQLEHAFTMGFTNPATVCLYNS
ncbi:hypothetical protein ACHHYP_20376 [Achlya hypogyna]|uniref:Uncharacterized protein n=1 Tax=Achlya hypogyna TaxID=1202772 RepID=A0A1V9ZKH9_ACHHY|nr:hypothetical protein ACHHYP_20376 [Achlya hypogyna]